MEENRDLFEAIEGVDENGEARAVCCLMIEKKFQDTNVSPEIQKIAYMMDARVTVSLTSDFAVVDLTFDSYVDYDYIQAGDLCKEYTAMTDARYLAEDSELSLVLSITAKGDYEFFWMGMDAAWSFMPERPEGMCNIIRLIFIREKFGAYAFGEEAVRQIIEDAAEEVEEQGI